MTVSRRFIPLGAAFLTLLLSLSMQAAAPSLGNSVLVATHSIQIDRDGVVVSGDLVVNQAGAAPFLGEAALALDQGVSTPAGYALRSNSIDIDSGATVGGDAFYNVLNNGGTIVGASVSPLSLPVLASLPALHVPGSPSLGAVNVAKNATVTIAAGVYSALNVGDHGTAHFSGGNYTFSSITGARGATLFFDDASLVVVTGRINLGQESTLGPVDSLRGGASRIMIDVIGINGSDAGMLSTPQAVAIGKTSSVKAAINAPNGTISIDRDTVAEGTLIARDILIARGGRLTLNSPFANLPPTAVPQSVFTSGSAPLAITLAGNDPEGADLAFSIVTPPTQGTLSAIVPGTAPVADATVTYSPLTSGNVADSFTFQVTDSFGATATAVVKINPPITDGGGPPPVTVTAVDGSGQQVQGEPASYTISGTAPPDVTLTFTIVTGSGPFHGTILEIVQSPDVPQRIARVTYVPDVGYVGSDSFDFQVCGDVGRETVCDTGTFTILVLPGDNNGR